MSGAENSGTWRSSAGIADRLNKMPLARFRPKLLDCLKDYTPELLAKDMAAGVTVGVLALPLAIAFAIASGCSPVAGIWTAIVAGFIISLLGGSRVQIGGPTGAFIPIVFGIVSIYGFQNLMVATIIAGVLLFLMGLSKMGVLIRFIPISVVIGFTNGIAVNPAAFALLAFSRFNGYLKGIQTGSCFSTFQAFFNFSLGNDEEICQIFFYCLQYV